MKTNSRGGLLPLKQRFNSSQLARRAERIAFRKATELYRWSENERQKTFVQQWASRFAYAMRRTRVAFINSYNQSLARELASMQAQRQQVKQDSMLARGAKSVRNFIGSLLMYGRRGA